MPHYYLEVAANDTVTGHIVRDKPFEGFNPSGSNGKPYYKIVSGGNVSIATPTAYQTLGTPVYTLMPATITISAVNKSLADCKAIKLAQLAAYRYEQEVGGITVSGVPVATDRQSQSLMTAARIIAKEDANYTVNWKGEAGFVTLNAAAIIAIADAVRGHVQDCFDNEKTHSDAIDALTTAAAVAAYDFTTGW